MRFLFLLSLLFVFSCCQAQADKKGPRVLVVIAHPDDETTISVTLYKIAKEQHGQVDLFVVTNGEAGYKYATLAENYYDSPLTDEKAGRRNLPGIRKKELLNAGRILGISNYYFGGQCDARFTLNERQPLDSCWKVTEVSKRLKKILLKNKYDFVFCMLPEPQTHGQHKAATLIALKVLQEIPVANRPVIMGALLAGKDEPKFKFGQLNGYPETQVTTDTASFSINRNESFSYHNRVNYKVIANWDIAEHKSQGVTQMTMNEGDLEEFWFFKENDSAGFEKSVQLFNGLKHTPYLSVNY